MKLIGFHLNGLNRVGLMFDIQIEYRCTIIPLFYTRRSR